MDRKVIPVWISYFNSNDDIDWYFNATAPTTRTLDEVDFVEVLAHEIGHGLGLAHNEENNNSIIFQGYNVRTGAIRSMDGNLELRENALVKNNANLTILDNSDVTFGTISTNPTLTINSGSKFIVEEGVTFNMWESSDIYAEGKVSMLGTSGNEIVFDKVPTFGTWDGIWLEDSGTAVSKFGHVIVKNAGTGLRIYNTFAIDIFFGSKFDNNDDDGLHIENTSIIQII